jgi:hypothetical protein
MVVLSEWSEIAFQRRLVGPYDGLPDYYLNPLCQDLRSR